MTSYNLTKTTLLLYYNFPHNVFNGQILCETGNNTTFPIMFSIDDAFSYFYLQQFYLKGVYYLFILFIFTCTQFMSKSGFNFALMFIIINFIKKKVFIYLFDLSPFRRLIISISPAYMLHFASILTPFRRSTAAPTSRYVMIYKVPL